MLKRRPYPETHQQGTISIENVGLHFGEGLPEFVNDKYIKGDLGIQISSDGRVWVCINGVAFLRFSPHPNGKMSP